MMPLRLRTRLTLWYSCVLAGILALFAFTVTWEQGRVGLRRVDRELDGMTVTVAGLLADELAEADTPAQAATEVVSSLVRSGRYVAVLARDGRMLAATPGGPEVGDGRLGVASGIIGNGVAGNGVAHADVIGSSSAGGAVVAQTTPDGTWRVAVNRAENVGDGYVLVAAAPLADAARERREAQEAMWLGMPLLLLVAASGGFWLATVALRPITDMALRAAALPVDGSDDLGRSGRNDELGQLERAFNDLVARLRASLRTQRQFMADASHELRTPVSVMRAVSDVTLDHHHRDESEYRDALKLVGLQAQHVGRVLDDMLILARADAGGYPLRRQPLYLNELVHECCLSLASLADGRGVKVDECPSVDLPLTGDEDLLRRLVLNLLQNAVQHTPRGARVRVSVVQTPTAATVNVRDEGPGVPEADRHRIFDRFVQLDAARRRDGAGLGLAISRWIAEAHGGRLELESASATGSTFVATLPMPASDGTSATAAFG